MKKRNKAKDKRGTAEKERRREEEERNGKKKKNQRQCMSVAKRKTR